MARFVWRREHRDGVVAEVKADGRGEWSASAHLRRNPTVVVRSPKILISLSAAWQRADLLTQRTFDHVCSPDGCGEWQAIEKGAVQVLAVR